MDNGIRFVETIEPEAWKPLELSNVFILYTYRTGCSWIFTGTELAGLVYRQCGIFDSKEHAEEALLKFPDVLAKCTGDVPSFTRACIKEVALGKLGYETGKVWFYRHSSSRSEENPLKHIDRFDPIDNDPDCPTVLLGGNGRQVKESSWDNKVDSLNISGNNKEKSLTMTQDAGPSNGIVKLEGGKRTDADRKAIWAKVEENLKKPRDEQDIVEIRDRNNNKVGCLLHVGGNGWDAFSAIPKKESTDAVKVKQHVFTEEERKAIREEITMYFMEGQCSTRVPASVTRQGVSKSGTTLFNKAEEPKEQVQKLTVYPQPEGMKDGRVVCDYKTGRISVEGNETENSGANTALKQDDVRQTVYDLYAYRNDGWFRFKRVASFSSKMDAEKFLKCNRNLIVSGTYVGEPPIYGRAAIAEVYLGMVVEHAVATLWFYKDLCQVLDSNPPQYTGEFVETEYDSGFDITKLFAVDGCAGCRRTNYCK